MQSPGGGGAGGALPQTPEQKYRLIYLSASDDIGYMTQQAGAGVLMIGTDYGHQDMSVELDALRTLGERGDLDPVVAQKILDANPRALYGL